MNALVALALLAATAAEPAPGWLQNTEICNGWYRKWDDAAMANMRDMPFMIGVPADKAVIDKAHKQGNKVLVYVTFYQVPPKGEKYQGADIGDHPDWIVIHPNGQEGISVFASSDNPGWRTVCPNSKGYHDYVLQYTDAIMKLGADGVFIDNGHPDVVCHAPKFGKHEHIYPDKDNTYAYRKLLEEVRAKVKSFGADKITIVNPGEPRQEWVGACDGQMLESYICTYVSNTRWHSESRLRAFQETWGPLADKGNAIVALSYVGSTSNPVREDAYYCYAWARVSGFIWADWFSSKDAVKDLYKLRLGKALGPMKTGDGFYMREFERGIAAVAGESKGGSLTLSGKKYSRVHDLFTNKSVKPASSGDYLISLDKGRGRLFLVTRKSAPSKAD